MMELLAELYAVKKDFTLARQYSGRALDAMQASCGAESLAVATALASRGSVEEYANSLTSAMDDYAAALRIARKNPDSPAFEIAIMRHYAALLKATHRDREAKALAVEASSFQQQSLR